jgi:hypothetical protein
MGIYYDAGRKNIVINYEPTNYKTNYDTNRPIDYVTEDSGWEQYSYEDEDYRRTAIRKTVKIFEIRPNGSRRQVFSETFESPGRIDEDSGRTIIYSERNQDRFDSFNSRAGNKSLELRGGLDEKKIKENKKLNKQGAQFNSQNAAKNAANQATNNKYNQFRNTALSARGGDYVAVRDAIRRIGIGNENVFKDFYRGTKLQKWNTNLGAKPPYCPPDGPCFNGSWYLNTYGDVKNVWDNAVRNEDIDITERYGGNPEVFALAHYTNNGQYENRRGNPAEDTTRANQYAETPPTDAEIQDIRNKQLGVDLDTQTQRLLSVPEIAAQWDAAKNGDPYWEQMAKDYYLDVEKEDDFATLFRLSERPEDKQIAFNYNINEGYGITELEDAIIEAAGEKAVVDVKKFGALAQNVLKDTIDEMKKVKARESNLELYKGFPGVSEVFNLNQTLTNSILGDTGVGGVLSFMGGDKAEESLEKALQGVTGVNNNVTYNWQQWFDDSLKKKYGKAIKLGLTQEEAEEQIKIESEFAKEFIDQYLIPRFDTSRSMDEFVEYLDVRQEEQNPFQTQDLLNALTQTANLRAERFLDQIKSTGTRYFDPNFYFNPTGNEARAADYAKQAETVAADWKAAKKGDAYWAKQAYRFGVDVNDKNAFARMHFEVKGQGQGYDAAEDILTADKVQDEIYNKILPSLEEEALEQGTVFGQFILPEEFADEMLSGLDPNDTETWKETLEKLGLEDFTGTLEELREYIIEGLRTGSAQEIREQIKYLNEKRKKPTQEILGITYIEREEDYKDEQPAAETELYKVFQSAGFQGTEDEFYDEFFPDLNREDQALLTKAGSDEGLSFEFGDYSDPFASLASIESFFGDEEDETDDEEEDDGPTTNYFSLDLNLDDEDEDYKSKTATSILGDFTSGFNLFK